MHPAAEHPGRVDAILARDRRDRGACRTRATEPLLRVHRADYLDFLRTAHAEWRAAGREGDAFPYTFPVVGRRPLDLSRIDARLGQYSFDTSTPIGRGHLGGSLLGAQTALAALDAVLGGERTRLRLVPAARPPCRRATISAAIPTSTMPRSAAELRSPRASSASRSSTSTIITATARRTSSTGRDDVLFASIHADPATDYPFFWGHADERSGEGKAHPQPAAAARHRLERLRSRRWPRRSTGSSKHAPDLLIVSYGADTYEADPISYFKLKTGDYAPMARRIASLGLPTLVVMEGGYAVEALGANVAAFLSGF